MNKYQAAFDRLSHNAKENIDNQWYRDCGAIDPLKLTQHTYQVMLIQELIERATPKKVITEGHSEELGECPACRMLMDQFDYPHFCPRKGCGQAVYWSEDE